ncbi:GNAT family protein [Kribbella sancticallisti]|uniref:GNAT family protein n=1 Tax=Kribbella sancticallisti TaxID=460087 RepID=A0ABN2DS46_9ACTN
MPPGLSTGVARVAEDARVGTRLVTIEGARGLAELLRVNREFLAPWDPVRDDEFFTVAGQRAVVGAALEQYEQGWCLPWVITGDDDRVVGRVSLTGIVRGPLQSCSLGYWVGAADNGRGFATAAVREIIRAAFVDLGLHRIEASTQLANVGSQRVLERAGFTRIGVAPEYLSVDGEWKDVVPYQLVSRQ